MAYFELLRFVYNITEIFHKSREERKCEIFHFLHFHSFTSRFSRPLKYFYSNSPFSLSQSQSQPKSMSTRFCHSWKCLKQLLCDLCRSTVPVPVVQMLFNEPPTEIHILDSHLYFSLNKYYSPTLLLLYIYLISICSCGENECYKCPYYFLSYYFFKTY